MYAYSVVRLDEGVVDGDDLDLVVLDTVGDVNHLTKQRRSCCGRRNLRIAEDDSSNTTEAVDSDLGWSHDC